MIQNTYNLSFPNWNSIDSDCCNFTSQCWWVGGLKFVNSPTAFTERASEKNFYTTMDTSSSKWYCKSNVYNNTRYFKCSSTWSETYKFYEACDDGCLDSFVNYYSSKESNFNYFINAYKNYSLL